MSLSDFINQGHSLGGAFCTLTYGEFLRRQADSPYTTFNYGDMYSLAAPRSCLEPFASEVNANIKPAGGKYLFRIVNGLDPVPTVPPPTGQQLLEYPFIHVGGAWEISQSAPTKMADEPPPINPQSFPDIIWNVKNHRMHRHLAGLFCILTTGTETSDYYASWQQTPHS
jgi:hypothetical protein